LTRLCLPYLPAAQSKGESHAQDRQRRQPGRNPSSNGLDWLCRPGADAKSGPRHPRDCVQGWPPAKLQPGRHRTCGVSYRRVGSALSASGPSRGHFFGKWEVGDGSGSTFYITLQKDGDAKRSLGDVHGKWVYVNGEAQITWDDGAEDAIRRVGSLYQKFAYRAGKSFSDVPDNVTSASNITPKPI
jgi:hypothetical protein